MKTHRKITALVGVSLLAIMIIVAYSLLNLMTAFSSVTAETELASQEIRHVEHIEKELASLASYLHSYGITRDTKYRALFDEALAAVQARIDAFDAMNLSDGDRGFSRVFHAALGHLKKKTDRIFLLSDPGRGDRAEFRSLGNEAEKSVALLRNVIDAFHKETGDRQLNKLSDYFRFLKARVVVLFFSILITSMGFLLGIAIYIHRSLAVPLGNLREGAGEISRGNLEYRIQAKGAGDVALLAERFNEMADKLRGSYAELEQKLLERTNELAAIDAVALTLSQAGTLNDVLTKSLHRIIGGLPGLAPQGGIFLCDPDGEALRLVSQQGLAPEFARQEETIKMGECLCGMVAQTGEILFSREGCEDPRHTRNKSTPAHGHIIIPMKSRGIVLGVIFLYTTGDFSLKSSDVQMLDAIGAQLGLAIENFQFYAEVKQSSEKYWDLFENARDILFTVDTEGRLTAVNTAAENFSGYSKLELAGKNVLDFIAVPKDIEPARRILAGENIAEHTVTEIEVVKRDSSRAFLEVSLRKLFRNQTLSGFQISARDITEQKKMREVFVKAQRLGAIEQLGVAVRHEINNPLTTVIGNVELLIERYEKKDPDLTSRLEVILSNSLRIAEITKRLQEIKKEKSVDYLTGVKMIDLK